MFIETPIYNGIFKALKIYFVIDEAIKYSHEIYYNKDCQNMNLGSSPKLFCVLAME